MQLLTLSTQESVTKFLGLRGSSLVARSKEVKAEIIRIRNDFNIHSAKILSIFIFLGC